VPASDNVLEPIVARESASVARLPTVVPAAVVPSASEPETVNVPALTGVAPVYVFAPERVRLPQTDLVIPPLPRITLEAVVLPIPLKVAKNPPLLMVLLKVSSVPALPMVVAAARVIAPP